MAISKPLIPGWGINQILEAQRKKGMSEETIEEAKNRAEEIIRKREEERRNPRIDVAKDNQPKLN